MPASRSALSRSCPPRTSPPARSIAAPAPPHPALGPAGAEPAGAIDRPPVAPLGAAQLADQPMRHLDVVGVAERVLQRLQVPDIGLDRPPAVEAAQQLDRVAQLLQG